MRPLLLALALFAASCATSPKTSAPLPQPTGSYAVSVTGFFIETVPSFRSTRIETSEYLEAVRDAMQQSFGLASPPTDGSILVYVYEHPTVLTSGQSTGEPVSIQYTIKLASGKEIKGWKNGGERRSERDARYLAQDLAREIVRRLR
ncbi:MAG: hypothetical protein JOZ54_02475 [Acidobacteria bacterium]|nr:hypothetical protein [Acidobacteriota bacterium]